MPAAIAVLTLATGSRPVGDPNLLPVLRTEPNEFTPALTWEHPRTDAEPWQCAALRSGEPWTEEPTGGRLC
jgi:hypothetical protein